MALFMLANCSEELDVMTKSPEQQNFSGKKHKILYGKEALEKRDMLIGNLKKDGGKGLNKLGRTMRDDATMKTNMEDIEDLIDYSEVYEVDQGNGVVHYTYFLNHPDTADDKFFNIILKTYSGLEKVIMVTYSLEKEFALDYSQNGDFTKFTGTVSFETVSAGSGFPCDEEPENPVPVSGGSGSNGGGNPGGYFPDYGDGDGSGNGGNPYNQALVDAKFQSMQISAWSNPEYGEPWEMVSRSPRRATIIGTNFELVDPSNPCGDDEETAIIEPQHEKNCEELKNLSNNKVKQSLETLKLIANDPTSEHGYSISKNTDITTTEIQNNPPFTGISMGMTLPYPPVSDNAIGVMHSHMNDYLGYLMFSAQDLFYFYNIISKHTVPQGQFKHFNDYTLIVVSHQGTYALKIENFSKFIIAMGSYNKDFIQELDDMYQNRHPMDPISHFEKDFLGFMSDHNMGVALYKAEEDLSTWNKLELNGNWNNNDGDDVKSIPCK